MGVQEVRWDKGGTVRAGYYIFFLWEMKRKSSIGNRFSVHHRIVSAVKRVEFVSDRMSYIVLRSHWYNNIFLFVHVPSEEKSDDSKASFYEELEQVSYHFPKYQMKILFADFNAKVGRKYFETDNWE